MPRPHGTTGLRQGRFRPPPRSTCSHGTGFVTVPGIVSASPLRYAEPRGRTVHTQTHLNGNGRLLTPHHRGE